MPNASEEGYSTEPEPIEVFQVPPIHIPQDDEESLLTFPEEAKEPLTGLLYLGAGTKIFSWSGHEFKIKVMTEADRLRVALLSKPYIGTSEELRAWYMAQVAMSVMWVDHQSISVSLNPDDDDSDLRFKWAVSQYPWTIDAIYSEILNLEEKVQKSLEAMGKA